MPLDRILVVDDEETIREIVSSMLAGAHFQTRQAASGVEAMSLLDSGEEFDLVLSDLMMAEMDGIALLERAKEKYPDVPVVMVTAVHDIQVALQALRNGAYDYLLKPFEREQLLATVRRALENRRLKRENDAYRTNLEALVLTTSRSKLWATRSTRRIGRPKITLNASPLSPSRSRKKWACKKMRSASSLAAPSSMTSAKWRFPRRSSPNPANSLPRKSMS